MRTLSIVLLSVSAAAIIYVLLVGYDGLIKLATSLFRVTGFSEALHNAPRKRRLSADSAMPVSIILPDSDKDPEIADTVTDLLELDYPEYEIILVCDSESGDALNKLIDAFSMVKIHQPIKRSIPTENIRAVYRSPKFMNITVLDKEGVGRYDAMNAGVNVSRYPLFVILGAGLRLEKDALTQIAIAFARNFSTVVVGCLPRIHGRGKPLGFLGSMQEAEYLRTFPAGLTVVDKKKMSVMPGAFGAYRKSAILKENGFIRSGSEIEMVVRLTRESIIKGEKYEFEMLPIPILISDPPKHLSQLIHQRIKWQAETVLSLWQNRGMLFNPKFGRAGMLDSPYYWLFNVLGPFIELIGCIVVPVAFIFGIIGIDIFVAFLAVEILFNTIVSLSAVVSQEILDNDDIITGRTFRRTISAIINNFGYRQIILLFSIFGVFSLFGKRKRVME